MEKDRVNPKFGLQWEPTSETTIRVAAFQMLQGYAGSRQDIRPSLEPTSVAGFNQVFFSPEGDRVSHYGVGIDQRFSSEISGGIEFARRDVDTPIAIAKPPPDIGFDNVILNVDEDAIRAYLYWTPQSRLAVRAEYQYDKFDNEVPYITQGYVTLETSRVPLGLSYLHPNGLGAAVQVMFVDQRGHLWNTSAPPFLPTRDADDFWVTDLSVHYRLPRRFGILSVDVRNLLDEEFQYQDIDPENTRIMPERLLLVRLTLAL